MEPRASHTSPTSVVFCPQPALPQFTEKKINRCQQLCGHGDSFPYEPYQRGLLSQRKKLNNFADMETRAPHVSPTSVGLKTHNQLRHRVLNLMGIPFDLNTFTSNF